VRASPDGDMAEVDGGVHPDVEATDDFLPALPANGATLRGRPAAPTPARSRSSSLSSAPSTPPPSTPASAPGTPLTKRARKRAGLPRTRAPGSAGKIRIPGGRMRVRAREPEPASAPEKEREWVTNGSGRMDVRGFRELKI
jgi:OTU domain-containing protein 3